MIHMHTREVAHGIDEVLVLLGPLVPTVRPVRCGLWESPGIYNFVSFNGPLRA